MSSYNLSYVITTRNRLAFLKITLEKLLLELQPDEEVVIVDSNSTDGSKEYLEQLFTAGKIHQYISEPDHNQAHGWNKAMLMAKGILIKKIIDDDVFCYPAIQTCKKYMLQNVRVDVLISNDLSSSLNNNTIIEKHTRLSQFEGWRKGLTPSFTFGDVHMMIRRSSLAYIGLYNTSYIMMDWEYSLRISYIRANITYYTGYNALSVAHPQTISSLKNEKLINKQGKKGEIFYEYNGDAAEISYWSKIKIFIGNAIHKQQQLSVKTSDNVSETDNSLIYDHYYNYISDLNKSSSFIFIEGF